MGKTNAKMQGHKAVHVLPLSKGTPAVGIASSSYFAACARHVGALALFGLMFLPRAGHGQPCTAPGHC